MLKAKTIVFKGKIPPTPLGKGAKSIAPLPKLPKGGWGIQIYFINDL